MALLLLSSCWYDPNRPPRVTYADTTGAPYNFYEPDTIFQLPIELSEISGLAAIDSTYLAAIQDELGKLYFIDAETGRVERTVNFARPDDYEGIELVGDVLFVLRSDGVLFQVTDWDTPTPVTAIVQTGIRPTCDAEGLTYDPSKHHLLIACKQGTSAALTHFRTVYAVDLEQDTLRAAPFATFDARKVSQHKNFDSPVDRKLRAFLANFIDLSGFTPSGLARHPESGRLFMLSSNQKVVLELTPDGDLYALWRLADRYFLQPEAIAFLPDGTLVVANEGAVGRGTLLRFSPQRRSVRPPTTDHGQRTTYQRSLVRVL